MKYVLSTLTCLAVCASSATAVAGKCKTEDPFPYTAPYNMENCPEDIQNWMNRVNTCAHFEGEEAYNDERKAELDNINIEYQCDYIGCDFGDLFYKYEGDIVYTGVLSDYEKFVYGDNGVLECNMEQEMPPEERVGDVYLEGATAVEEQVTPETVKKPTPKQDKSLEQELEDAGKKAVKDIFGGMFK